MDSSEFLTDSVAQPNSESASMSCEMRILRALRRIIRAVDIYSRKLNHDYGITTPQILCLYCLVHQGPMTLSRLAAEVKLSFSTVNGIIDRLEAKKLVERQRSVEDRRKVFVHALSAGIELTNSAPSLLQDKLAKSLSDLPELEQTALALSLERVVDLMEVKAIETSSALMPSTELN